MTLERAIELLAIERTCVERNAKGCNRDCAKCDLVQEDWELIEMYRYVIDRLSGDIYKAVVR